MRASIVLLPGDGIGPEVTAAATRVLRRVAELGGHQFSWAEAAIGGAAVDTIGEPLPSATLDACRGADAVLLGAVGGPQWANEPIKRRPEQALLQLRQELRLFANLRPVRVSPALANGTPWRPEHLDDVDLLIVRELASGLYYGPRHEEDQHGVAWDTLLYSEEQVQRVARTAFALAEGRRRQVCSVDKANVLASMRLWRRVVTAEGARHPTVQLEHQYVDACAMHLLQRPSTFDVVLAGNLFGDILSDLAAVLTGSLGLLPSASVGDDGPSLYEPVHGSAPDLVGLDVANPIGAILSASLLLRHALGLEHEAAMIEIAVDAALADGARTADMANAATRDSVVSTSTMTQRIVDQLEPIANTRRASGLGRCSQERCVV